MFFCFVFLEWTVCKGIPLEVQNVMSDKRMFRNSNNMSSKVKHPPYSKVLYYGNIDNRN